MPESAEMNSNDGGIRLFDVGQRLLDATVNAASLQLYDIPSKQFVTTGAAVFDCEQVSVSLLRVDSGLGLTPGAELVQAGPQCDVGWSVTAEVAIVRCAPTPSGRSGTVSADKINNAAKNSSKDVFILQSAIEAFAQDTFGGFSVEIIPEQHEGGMVATSAMIRTVM
ncbi:hypothetical protein PP301_gp024 [Gordonia phage GMA2]|uniref:Uncharacterized protein n=1 Tax=Gordonia phage GMA2 TaxID=1647283 RepID=A0A0K0N746_9CAUD|nr:hypothetical protein PP301_gp024 [Gordonia phage GMA2]AKJ72562.1 hypothetical protein GMA2_24 [Gordonia phage GMA2]